MKIITDIAALRNRCEEVTDFTGLDKIAGDLFGVMMGYNGPAGKAVAVAANQVGYKQRMFVMSMHPQPPVCIVNPVITKQKGWQTGPEGCLSLPGVKVVIQRPLRIVVKGHNQYGSFVKYKLSNYRARLVCHEIDHLDGKLITDYESKKD